MLPLINAHKAPNAAHKFPHVSITIGKRVMYDYFVYKTGKQPTSICVHIHKSTHSAYHIVAAWRHGDIDFSNGSKISQIAI
jgi:hypothetical protein